MTMINLEHQSTAKVTPEIIALAARLYTGKSQNPSIGDWLNAGTEVQVPPYFIEEVLEKIQAQQRQVEAHCKKMTIALASVVLAVASWGIVTENYLTRSAQKVDSAWTRVENKLQQRVEIIPQAIKTLQSDAQQKELINLLNRSRASYLDADTPSAKIVAIKQVSQAIDKFQGYLLKNPQLKSQEQLTNLRFKLASSGYSIILESLRYNQVVQLYNQKLQLFPNSLIVSVCGFEQKPFFGVATTETPKIN
ncbi:MAG TPA: LemA family protein [Oculatellaceae cyanobacterium]|jgi:LemA protein